MSNHIYSIRRSVGKWTTPVRYDRQKVVFKTNKSREYTPLFVILQGLYDGRNDLFAQNGSYYAETTIKYAATFNYLFNTYAVSTRWSGTNKVLAISLFSVLGQDKSVPNIPEGIIPSISYKSQRPIINLNNVDIITLAVMKTSDIPSVKIVNKCITFDLRKIKVLISQSKFKAVSYMEEFYNKGIRAALVREYNILKERGLTLEVVDDDVFKQYYDEPYFLKCNSIVEGDEIIQEIRDKTFERIFDYLEI
jgi:hypothetical protein